MQLDYFKSLYLHLSGSKGSQHQITLDDISELFYITRRHTNMIIRQLCDAHWIEWKPGKGRGNKSTIIFLAELHELIVAEAKRLIETGHVNEALHYANENLKGTIHYQVFFEWLKNYFGIQQHTTDNKPQDLLRIPLYRPILTLDPIVASSRIEIHLVNQIFDPLVQFHKPTQSFIPHLAHHWDTDQSGKVWTIHLRKGIYFHHGREMTAADVQYTLDRVRLTSNPYQWMVSDIERIDIINDYTVQVVHHLKNMLFLHYLSSPWLSIVPSDLDSFHSSPSGTGPFQVVEYRDTKLQLSAFPTYFGGRAHLDRIEIVVLDKVNDYQILDIDNQVVKCMEYPSNRSEENRVHENFKLIEYVEYGATYLTFNLFKAGYQQDKAFRKAIYNLLDRTKLIQTLGNGRHCMAHSFLPHESVLHQAEPPNIELALDLLAQSTYKEQSVKIFTYQSKANQENIRWIQEELQAAGLKVDISILPIEDFLDPKKMKEADLLLTDSILEDNIEFSLFESYCSDNSFIRNQIGEEFLPYLEQKLESLKTTDDRAGRMNILLEIEAFLKEHDLLIFLYHNQQALNYHPSINGVTFNSLGSVDYKDLWINPLNK